MLMDSVTFISGADHFYDIVGSTLQPPSDDDVVIRFKMVRPLKFPTLLTGSEFEAGVAPNGGDAVFSIRINGTEVGQIVFPDGSTTANVTFAQEVSLSVGDKVEVVTVTANNIDAVYFTFKTLAA